MASVNCRCECVYAAQGVPCLSPEGSQGRRQLPRSLIGKKRLEEMDGWMGFRSELKTNGKNMLKVAKHSQMSPTPLWLNQGDSPSAF